MWSIFNWNRNNCIYVQLWSEVAEQLTSGVAEYSTALGDVCLLLQAGAVCLCHSFCEQDKFWTR